MDGLTFTNSAPKAGEIGVESLYENPSQEEVGADRLVFLNIH